MYKCFTLLQKMLMQRLFVMVHGSTCNICFAFTVQKVHWSTSMKVFIKEPLCFKSATLSLRHEALPESLPGYKSHTPMVSIKPCTF